MRHTVAPKMNVSAEADRRGIACGESKPDQDKLASRSSLT